jgi:AmpD protein
MKLEIDPATGWVFGAERVYSPNFDERPVGATLDLIVVHGISLPPGQFGGRAIDELFTNRLDADAHGYFRTITELRVSSHMLIRRDGSLTQFVAFSARAWHAGESQWCGRRACNDFAIGIELEGTDELPYEDRQYESLAALVAALRDAYPRLVCCTCGSCACSTRITTGSSRSPGRTPPR